ncbi:MULTISPECIES: four-helix bundle copper-binding protein [Pseudomonas]|uniref:four-helix bundle copper-binding protein n=1 Tax=Pseudomonas TaxID=286 RepID=UPI00161F114D|nr:four-helix bundle copper-binding protein [Pseudomonas sp. TUM22785]MBB4821010.1 hypothetical protein [Pseudomonas alcaligenes]WCD83395.1 four-helix bundle copper-binding protein [Pseudomonas sp. TUM22785]
MNAEAQACADACLVCADECAQCVTASRLDEGGEYLERCIELSRECADSCLLMQELVERESAQVVGFGRFCASICRLCAAECRRHDLAHCQRLAQVCEDCAQQCQGLALAA